jgi:hypothetical protein
LITTISVWIVTSLLASGLLGWRMSIIGPGAGFQYCNQLSGSRTVTGAGMPKISSGHHGFQVTPVGGKWAWTIIRFISR